jgi:hypothetical protein
MRPRTRNGLAVLALLLLLGGIVAALVHDNDGGTKRPSNETAQPAPTTAPTTSVTPTPSPLATTPPNGGATATAAMTRQPRTGGPATLPIGLLLVAAGLVALRLHAAAVRAVGAGD